MPRKRHVSRNMVDARDISRDDMVMPRKRHVSRNFFNALACGIYQVMPRKRHVSRNFVPAPLNIRGGSHASQEACE